MKKVHMLFPGSFSPYTDGHYLILKRFTDWAASEYGDDGFDVTIIKSNNERGDMNRDVMIAFIKAVYSNDSRVRVVSSAKKGKGPISACYGIVNRNDGRFILVRSGKDGDGAYEDFVNNFRKGGKGWRKGVEVIDPKLEMSPLMYQDGPHKDSPISATEVRNDIRKNDFGAFKTSYSNIQKDCPSVSDRVLRILFDKSRGFISVDEEAVWKSSSVTRFFGTIRSLYESPLYENCRFPDRGSALYEICHVDTVFDDVIKDTAGRLISALNSRKSCIIDTEYSYQPDRRICIKSGDGYRIYYNIKEFEPEVSRNPMYVDTGITDRIVIFVNIDYDFELNGTRDDVWKNIAGYLEHEFRHVSEYFRKDGSISNGGGIPSGDFDSLADNDPIARTVSGFIDGIDDREVNARLNHAAEFLTEIGPERLQEIADSKPCIYKVEKLDRILSETGIDRLVLPKAVSSMTAVFRSFSNFSDTGVDELDVRVHSGQARKAWKYLMYILKYTEPYVTKYLDGRTVRNLRDKYSDGRFNGNDAVDDLTEIYSSSSYDGIVNLMRNTLWGHLDRLGVKL